ncbi:hypothetical protein [Methanospirillum lacunae]|uniref:hypothetical protein n=1 Tax=Methanospirillum lacunae TaxID=668570 RepID=UPI0038FCF9D5
MLPSGHLQYRIQPSWPGIQDLSSRYLSHQGHWTLQAQSHSWHAQMQQNLLLPQLCLRTLQ